MPSKIAAGALLLVREGNQTYVLMQQRSEEEHEPLTWSSYGGMRERHESPVDCMIREVDEEAGIDVSKCTRMPVHQFEDPVDDFAYYTFAVRLPRRVQPRHSRETVAAQWVPLGATRETLWENVPTPLHSGMRALVNSAHAAELIDLFRR